MSEGRQRLGMTIRLNSSDINSRDSDGATQSVTVRFGRRDSDGATRKARQDDATVGRHKSDGATRTA